MCFRLITIFGPFGIFAASAIPVDPWVQLGLGGALAFLLYYHISRSNRTIDDMNKSQEMRVAKISDNLTDLKNTIEKGNDSLRDILSKSQNEANEILKKALHLKNGS